MFQIILPKAENFAGQRQRQIKFQASEFACHICFGVSGNLAQSIKLAALVQECAQAGRNAVVAGVKVNDLVAHNSAEARMFAVKKTN